MKRCPTVPVAPRTATVRLRITLKSDAWAAGLLEAVVVHVAYRLVADRLVDLVRGRVRDSALSGAVEGPLEPADQLAVHLRRVGHIHLVIAHAARRQRDQTRAGC